MPKAGEIHVRLTRGAARSSAEWLKTWYVPWVLGQSDTILMSGYNLAKANKLTSVASVLERAAVRRRRTGIFTINLPRAFVLAFISAVEESRYRPGGPFVSRIRLLPRGVLRIWLAMKGSSKSRRGRPRLTKTDRLKRVNGRHVVDLRHRQRLARKMKYEEAFARWSIETSERGETLLTASVPPPEI